MESSLSTRARPWLAALGLSGLATLSCQDLPTNFEPLPAVRLDITGGDCRSGLSLRVIHSRDCEVEATAWDANNQEVFVGFIWSTVNPAVATVIPKSGFDTMVAEITGVSVDTTSLIIEVGGQPDLVVIRKVFVIPSNNPDL